MRIEYNKLIRDRIPRLLRLQGTGGYSMVEDLRAYPWVLEIYEYEDTPRLLASISKHVIEPAERKVEEIRQKK